MKYLALLVLLVGCSKFHTAQFKVGDCITYNEDSIMYSDNEFLTEDIPVFKILQVGERNYLYEHGYDLGMRVKSEAEIYIVDKYRKKVTCPEGI